MSLVRALAGALAFLILGRPRAGAYGPYYRTGSKQSDDVTRRQVASSELWGHPDRGSDRPSVDAWVGHLPAGRPGVEFYTDVPPDHGTPPGRARWTGPRPGVRVEGLTARIKGRIVQTRFRS